MNAFAFRALLVAGALALAWVWIAWSERQAKSVLGLESGITVVTTETCSICPETVATLRSLAGSRPIRVLDASDPRADVVRASAAPTVVVADGSGREILRRTGRTTITDAARIVATAHSENLRRRSSTG